MKKLAYSSILSLLCFFTVNAQESIGLFQDNYLPSNGMLYNPAAPAVSPFSWQVNVIAVGAFAENNFVYLPHSSNLIFLSDINSQHSATVNFADVYSLHTHLYSFIQGPSAFVQLKNGITVGLITDEKYAASVVSSASAQDLSAFQHIVLGQNYIIPQFNAAYLHWTEIGINLGAVVYHAKNANLAIGVNVKYLGSTDGFYFNNNHSFNTNRDSLASQQSSIDASFGYSGAVGNNQPGSPLNFAFNGRGVGGDLGLLYTLNSVNEDELYNWKFGAAVNDIGAIRFNRQSSTYALNRETVFNAQNAVIQQINSLSTLATNGSSVVYDAANQAYTGSAYTMNLPMAVSLSASKSLSNNFYIEALAVRRVVYTQDEVLRPNTFALIPSYQKKWIGFALPFVVYDDSKIYPGFSFRIGPLTIGSDNIMSWFIPANYYGSDIYLGLHINPFNGSDKAGNADFRNPYHSHVSCPSFHKRRKSRKHTV